MDNPANGDKNLITSEQGTEKGKGIQEGRDESPSPDPFTEIEEREKRVKERREGEGCYLTAGKGLFAS